MKSITIYESFDGKKFNSRRECEQHEERLKAIEKANKIKVVKDFYLLLCEKYYSDQESDNAKIETLTDYRLLSWLKCDLEDLAIKGKCSLQDIKDLIKQNYGEKDRNLINEFIEWEEIELNIAIRSNFAEYLAKVKNGTELSYPLGFAFSERDISELAKLHKSNKFRKKIEDLLTDCNFHTECSDFENKNYSKYIKA